MTSVDTTIDVSIREVQINASPARRTDSHDAKIPQVKMWLLAFLLQYGRNRDFAKDYEY